MIFVIVSLYSVLNLDFCLLEFGCIIDSSRRIHQTLLIRRPLQGFDEYMNLVLDEAEEVSIKKNTRKPLGRILLKGDNITLMMNT